MSEAWAAVRNQLLEHTGEIKADEPQALIAELLRRAAAVRCPCPAPALVDGVADAIAEVAPAPMRSRELVDDVFDSLIASGDFLTGRGDTGESRDTLVYLAPPTYVRRGSGTVFVLGGSPDLGLSLPAHLATRLASQGCHRLLLPEGDEDLVGQLDGEGFLDYPVDAWLEAPVPRAASALISDLESRLAALGPAGDVQGLLILDPDRPSTFYRARWTLPGRRTGRFVARRPQRWGAPLWCYVELVGGQANRLIDFPCVDLRFRGCDEAWWVQCAIDAARDQPQVLEVTKTQDGHVRISTHTPLPMWAERRVLLLGQVHPEREKGALLTFSLQEHEAREDILFLTTNLWLRVQEIPGT